MKKIGCLFCALALLLALVFPVGAVTPVDTERICSLNAHRGAALAAYVVADQRIQVPAYGIMLPVVGQWDAGKTASFPCRYYGSIYDGTLIIGGSDQAGQFDFCDRIDMGDTVTVTDMTGAVYTYTVRIVERASAADTDILVSEQDDLTLFVRDAGDLAYILVRCELDTGA